MSDILIHSLYKIGAIKFGEFTLKSGQSSSIYLDLRPLISYPDLLRAIAEKMWNKIFLQSFDVICGVPYTALPIATCISLQHNMPMVMRRKEKKSYGTQQLIEGVFKPGQHCLVIEDVITSGVSILETADDLEQAGLKINDAIVLIDRNQGGRENLQKRNYHLHTVFTLEEILQHLFNSHLLNEKESAIVNALLVERV